MSWCMQPDPCDNVEDLCEDLRNPTSAGESGDPDTNSDASGSASDHSDSGDDRPRRRRRRRRRELIRIDQIFIDFTPVTFTTPGQARNVLS